jgi:hypothetical protein
MRLKYLALARSGRADRAGGRASAKTPVIVVTGQGLEQTPATPAYDVIELDRDKIVSGSSGRIEDVLSNVAGFQQFRRSDSRSSNPSAQGATLRALGGNATSRALVLLDAVPMLDPFFGYVPFSAIAPERLESIRVTRGGGSGPFGSGALAGAIELDSADAATLGLFSGRPRSTTAPRPSCRAPVAPEIGDGFAVVSGRWDRGKGFWTTPEASACPRACAPSSTPGRRARGWCSRCPTDIEVQVRGMAFDDERVLRFAGPTPPARGRTSAPAGQPRAVAGRLRWPTGQWRNFTNVVISSTTVQQVARPEGHPVARFGGKLEVRPPVGGGHTLRFGSDYRARKATSPRTRSTHDRRADRAPLRRRGQHRPRAVPRGRLGARSGHADRRRARRSLRDRGRLFPLGQRGGRDDREQPYPSARTGPSPTARVRSASAEGVQAARGRLHGLRLPTLNELYRPFAVFPVTTNANAGAAQREARRVRGGDRLARGRHSQLLADRVRQRGRERDHQRHHRHQRAPAAEHRRDRGAGTRVGDADAVRRVRLRRHAGLDRCRDARIGRGGGARRLAPAQTPEWAASGTFSWRPERRHDLLATLRHVGQQYEDDLQTDSLPAATTVDLFAQVRLVDKLSFVGRVENLFDEEIVTRNQGGSMDLGVPLTVWGGSALRILDEARAASLLPGTRPSPAAIS